MQPLDDMPLHTAIKLYYEKHQAIRQGNLEKLISMKQQYPQIFNKEKDKEIRDLILYAKEFQQTVRYKELRKLVLQEQLTIIHNDGEKE
jgi:hypothetical protein